MKKLITKKNVAIFMGIVPLVYSMMAIYLRDTEFLGSFVSSLFEYTSLFVITLLISIPAYFMRREVHDYWFDRMMKIYMPIACGLVFLVAMASRGTGGGFGPSVGGVEIILTLFVVTVGFLALSVILIMKKYAELKKK